MPDLTPEGRAGVEIMVGTFDSFLGDTTVMRLDLSGQFKVAPKFLITALLPIAYADVDVALVDDDDGLGLGNLRVGGLFTSTSPRGNGGLMRLGLGFAVSLPTASDSDEAGAAALLNALFFIPDFSRTLPNTTAIHLHGDVRHEGAGLFFQGQLGLDHLLLEDEQEDLSLLRFGLAGGFSFTSHMAALLELTTISNLLEDDEGDDEEFVHTLDVGMRYHDPTTIAGARIYIPLDDQLRDADMLGFALDIGMRF
jgi:hypothetical protein